MPIKHDQYGFLIGEGADSRTPSTFEQWAEIAKDVRFMRLWLMRRQKDCERNDANKGDKKDSQHHSYAPAKQKRTGTEAISENAPGSRREGADRQAAITPIAKEIKAATRQMQRSVSAIESIAESVGSEAKDKGGDSTTANRRDAVKKPRPSIKASPKVGDGSPSKKSERDAQGRFVGGDDGGSGANSSAIIDAISGASSRISASLAGAEQLDPAIAAMQEVAAPVQAIASPVIGGISWLMGGRNRDKAPKWYQRIWRELKLSRTEGNSWDKKQLKAIEESKEGGSSPSWLMMLLMGIGGILAKLLNPLKWAGALSGVLAKLLPGLLAKRLLGGLPGTGGIDIDRRHKGARKRSRIGRIFDRGKEKARRAFEWGKEKAPVVAGSAKRYGRKASSTIAGVGKRIGKVRGLGMIGGLLALAGIADVEMDGGLSREQKNQQHGANVGRAATGMAGAGIGAAIGTAILPGIGTVIGGLIGGYAADYFAGDASADIGSRFATWVSTVDIASIPTGIKAKFSEWTEQLKGSEIGKYITGAWDSLTTGIKSAWEKVSKGWSDALDTANGWLKDKTGVDVGRVASDIGNAASDVGYYARDVTNNAAQSVGEVASSAWNGITGTVSDRQAILLAEAKKAGITSTKELANFMGQTDHETGGFNRMEENLNYSAKGLLKTFKGRNGINTLADAQRVVDGGKESIANAVYGGAWGKKNLGNTDPGDGFKYRGRGFKQLTGKSNYEQAGKALGIDLANHPELAENPEVAAKIATWYWKKRVPESARKDVAAATKAINGGTNGLKDRIKQSAKWESLIASGEADKIGMGASGMGLAAVSSGMASAASMGASAYSMGKSAINKGRALLDGALPESMKGLMVKDSDGKAKTLGSMGIASYSDLQSKGGQAFAGGHNNPETLYATNLIAKGLGSNFDRVTAQNDLYHQRKSPNSEHTKGSKTDFTVKGISSQEADARITEIMGKYGLQKGIDFKTIDEYEKPSGKATGGHMDFKLNESGQAKIAKFMELERMVSKPGVQPASPSLKLPSLPPVASGMIKAAMPSLPSLPVLPKVDVEAPPSPKASSSSSATANVRLPGSEVKAGRDVPERTIAHIVAPVMRN